VALLALSGCLTPVDVLFPRVDGGNVSRCEGSRVPLCDGFENASLQAPWTPVVLSGGSLDLDPSVVERGSQSVHAHTAATDAGLVQSELTQIAVVPNPNFYLRAFVFLLAPAPTRLTRLGGYLSKTTSFNGAGLFLDQGALRLGSDSAFGPIASTPFPTGRWVCVEWQVSVGATGELRVWLDGVEAAEARYAGPVRTTLDHLSLGIAMFGISTPQPAYDLWIDEVAVDAQPIGCAP
jgi:hypothetical protein